MAKRSGLADWSMARHKCGIVRNETGLKGCKRVRVGRKVSEDEACAF